ncbi:hypothetical protein BDA99DRAFT_257924 [Phascolomyces articulosus]|uniref:Uncharacterized protein n=1 Tax=Phascolomyces articulosus TaxID=60185 RepID=A0AAD5JYW7_9FUNG|nr:hypothetical protein BDA99DRAFT_257924 [Phascolomyces articulosus]
MVNHVHEMLSIVRKSLYYFYSDEKKKKKFVTSHHSRVLSNFYLFMINVIFYIGRNIMAIDAPTATKDRNKIIIAYCPFKNCKFKCRRNHIYEHIRNKHMRNLPPIEIGSNGGGRHGSIPMILTNDERLINILNESSARNSVNPGEQIKVVHIRRSHLQQKTI